MNNFELIKDQIKLTEVLDAELDLKRSGKVYKALCPFHDERTPSFTLYPKEQTFHCFGCQQGGTVIDYIMLRENIKEPYEAIEYMADKYNVQIKGFDKEALQAKKKKIQDNRSEHKKHYKNVSRIKDFLESRGFTNETYKLFGVGFDLSKNAAVIPFLDTYGNMVGKVYRNFDDDKPKYINSAEDEVFKKSELLFGLDKARKHIKDKVYIVEGYFDMMALYQMGFKESVAFCSANITDGQAQLLSKYIQPTTKIYFIPDNDKTGLKSATKNIRTLKKYNSSNPISVYELDVKDTNDVLADGKNLSDYEPTHHEIFTLKIELDKCLEQIDEYEVAKRFINYTKNEMIRYEMAEYLSKRWNKPKEVVLNFTKSENVEIDDEVVIQDFSDAMDKFRKNAIEGAKSKIFFGLEKPDKRVNGIKKTEVAYLLGRSGSGKTTFLLNFLHNAIFGQKKNIVFNSLELDSSNIAPQLLQIHLGETEQKVTEMALAEDERLLETIETLDKHLRIIDKSGQTLDDVERYINLVNEEHFADGVDMVMIDYFSYLKRPMKSDNYSEYSAMAREIKQLAKRKNCVMFVLAQTNRTGKDGSEPLTMDAARDTGAIEESGDYVFGIYRPGAKADLTEEEKQANPNIMYEYYFQTLKNRWGTIGTDKLWFEGSLKKVSNYESWKERVY